jgi:hypothetical protein
MTEHSDVTGPSKLPRELIIQIFETAASSSRSTCRALCLVSSWARRLVLPYLFATVSIWSNFAFTSLMEISSRDPSRANFFPSDRVRGLWLIGSAPENIVHVYRACENLTHIATTTKAYHALAKSTRGLQSTQGNVPFIIYCATSLLLSQLRTYLGLRNLPFSLAKALHFHDPLMTWAVSTHQVHMRC